MKMWRIRTQITVHTSDDIHVYVTIVTSHFAQRVKNAQISSDKGDINCIRQGKGGIVIVIPEIENPIAKEDTMEKTKQKKGPTGKEQNCLHEKHRRGCSLSRCEQRLHQSYHED
jgi:hypothetical protein